MSSTKYHKHPIYVNQFALRTTQNVPKQAQKPAMGANKAGPQPNYKRTGQPLHGSSKLSTTIV